MDGEEVHAPEDCDEAGERDMTRGHELSVERIHSEALVMIRHLSL
ncbi:hypothetical protein ACFPRL_07550 [Pseudoclavibacter helvolus]